jgi:hypothetical protein
MLKPKFIISFPVYFVCLYLVISIFSCNKENPIAPPPPVSQDTADEYEWRVVEEDAGLNGEIFVSDTSHIYLFYDDGTCYRYDGANVFEEVNFNDPRFSVWEANSNDNKNIYFSGYSYFSTNYAPVTIKKMLNGNVIKTWISSKDSTPDRFGYIVTGDDDIWYGKAYKPYIYHLTSNNFTQYELDSGLQYNYLWKDKYNNIYAFGTRYYENLPITCAMYSYKFNGNRFDKISTDTLFYTLVMHPCGSDLLIRTPEWGLSFFTGNNWIRIMNYPNFNMYKVGGWSKDSLICFGFEHNPPLIVGYSPYIWRGNEWRREKKLTKLIIDDGYEGIEQVIINIMGDHVYFPARFHNYKYLIIGKKIKNKKINKY